LDEWKHFSPLINLQKSGNRSKSGRRRWQTFNPDLAGRKINRISPPEHDDFMPNFANFAVETVDDEVVANQNMENSSKQNAIEETAKYRQDPPADTLFVVVISDILSSKIRKSVASAICRGPPGKNFVDFFHELPYQY
jgi:hypothetical protein